MLNFRWLYLLFLVSGFPALLYQVVWQRTLYTIFGVNIESVTVVVSAFLLGLGLGSMLGGWLSNRKTISRFTIFGLIELGIAAFGIVSLPLFHWVAEFTAGSPPAQTFLITFGLIVFPTILMGATLPVLVAELVSRSGNVGRSVGMLYFANTLGSSAACFAAALVILPMLGMSGSVKVAAALNAAVGCSVLFFASKWRAPESSVIAPEQVSVAVLPFPAGIAIAGIAGFISLGYEIVWYRVYSFVSGGSPRCFSFVLGSFLAGIAFGSLCSRQLCRGRDKDSLLRAIAGLMMGATVLSFFTVPLLGYAVQWLSYEYTFPLIALAAGTLGAVFPLICHITVPSNASAGQGLSYLYLSNIIGSAAGTYFMGFILMDTWTLQGIAVFLAMLGLAIAFVILSMAGSKSYIAIALALFCWFYRFDAIYERLQFKDEYEPSDHFTDIVETRSGVVTVDKDRVIYGGGARDGILSTDLLNSDSCIRPFSLSYLHASPKQVLLIGVAGGAWAQIVGNHPQLESAVAVEINPGDLSVIARYPEVAPLLHNPKLEIVVDDGRRWMIRNRQRKFDAILMDTGQHWRANTTNLLSVEMLTLAREMLKPGGIVYYNTTYSDDAQLTGVTMFPYAFRFGPFLAVSDSPLQLDEARWRKTLLSYRLGGKSVLDAADPSALKRLDQLATYLNRKDSTGNEHLAVEELENIRQRTRNARVITDDNMASEWKR